MRSIWLILLIGLFLIQPVSADFPAQGTYISLETNSSKSYSQFDGKVMLVQAFAEWCESCKEEMFELSRIDNVYGEKGSNNLTIFSLSVSPATDTVEDIRQVRSEAEEIFDFKATWEFGLDSSRSESFADQLQILILPTLLLINENGSVEKRWEGKVTANEISNYLDANVTFPETNPYNTLIDQITGNMFFRVFSIFVIMLSVWKFAYPSKNEIES